MIHVRAQLELASVLWIWELIIEQTLSFIYNNHTSQKFNTHFFPQESGSYCLWNVDKKQNNL